MNPLLVCLPLCSKDAALAKRLLEFIVDSSYKIGHHSILLAVDSQVQREFALELKSIALKSFHHAEVMFIKTPDDRQSWPKGPNFMFHAVIRQVMECYKLPFLWLEPDCVPMNPHWLNALADEYALCPKRYMGTMATVALSPDLPSRHMSGVAIYPSDAYRLMKDSCAGDMAFDYATSNLILGQSRACETKLIFEIFGSHTDIPTFKAVKSPGDKDNVLVPAVIPPEAVLFHRCKDGSLLDLMRNPTNEPGLGRPRLGLPAIQSAEDMLKDFSLSPEPSQPPESTQPEPPADEPKRRGRPPGTRIGLPESKMATL